MQKPVQDLSGEWEVLLKDGRKFSAHLPSTLDENRIGDPDRPVEAEDIPRTNRIMYAASILALLVFAGARLGIAALLF